jgi:signal transduction histidine kinase
LLALFLLITLVPSALLVAFGWRSLRLDRALELQQVEQRREQTADLIVTSLEQSLSGDEQSLRDRSGIEALPKTEDAAALLFTPGRIQAFPPGRLLYYPLASPGVEAPAHLFAAGEDLEYRRRDFAGAAKRFRDLARGSDAAVRAGALIRLARNLRSSGEPGLALAAYLEAAGIRGAAVGGIPADLLARWARCDLLQTLNRSAELRKEAGALYGELLTGRWQLDRATYELHIEDARRWLGNDPAIRAPGSGPPLAAAVEWLWNKWQRMPAQESRFSGREAIPIDGAQWTLLWEGNADRLSALVAGPEYAGRQWLAKLAPLLERQHVRVTLRDRATRLSGAHESRRAAGETGLPWTVAVESPALESELVRLAGRQTLWLAGLAILAVLVVAGTFIIARAAMRELAVARLQSDFVAAVSHEFRTPLATLAQLTEMLLDRRITSEDRRQTYYQALARQTERLRRLVESLLDFGRMEAGVSPYHLEPLDACALIRSVVEEFELEAAGRSYHVELDMNGVTASVAGDREALTNALWNLLDNAVKYSPQCRTVWVSVERDDGRVAIRVRDRGLGIPRDEQSEIFGRFVRGSGAKAENIKGAGIGLAMVRHIVKAHGGQVRVDSEPGSGSTFTMLLPVEEPCHAS